MKPKSMSLLISLLAAFTLAGCGGLKTAPPSTSYDGLLLVPDTKFEQVYRKPDADFSSYSEFGVTACEVAFRKNWMRDQNRDSLNLSHRVTQEDVDRIKKKLSAQCEAKFREALSEAPAYKLVEQFNKGEQVLILRPSIVNLDINAPDIQTAGISRTYTTSSGQMTLILELVDGTTGDVLARIIDRQEDRDSMQLQWTNSVTNNSDANRVLRSWTTMLRKGLDRIRSAPEAP